MQEHFLTNVFGQFGKLSRSAWLSMAALGLASAAAELAYWMLAPRLTAKVFVAVVLTAPVAVIAMIAVYIATVAMISRRPSTAGLLRFMASTAVLTSPIVTGLGAMLVLPPSPYKSAVATTSLVLLAAGWALIVFAPAWPVAQAVNGRLVSPLKVLRGTKGHRWSLLLASFLGGMFNRWMPTMSKAGSILEAFIYVIGHGLVAITTAILFTSIGVTAWRFAIRNDPTLYGDEPRPVGV